MIARSRSLLLCGLPLFVAGLFSPACEKVPLLAPSGATITVNSLATALPINGSTTITAVIVQNSGYPPHSGTQVNFTTTLGTIQPAAAETDVNGRVTVQFSAGTASGTATITATSGNATGTSSGSSGATGTTATGSASNVVKIAIGAAAVSSVSVGANPGTVSATGGSAAIVATVRDVNGNLLAGVPVTFTTDAGSLNPTVANTDANGTAQSTLSTTKTAKVTVSAGLTSGTSSTTTTGSGQSASVTVSINSATVVTVGSPSPSAPTVGQSVTFPITYSTDANASAIQRVVVDFGDGTAQATYTGKPGSTTHTYNSVGSYSIRVTATDALGDTSTGSTSVVISPLASITVGAASPSAPAVAQAVTFPLTYGSTGGSPIQRISVDFGDGTGAVSYSGTPSAVNHTYAAPGTYAVRVTAFDAFGNTSTGGNSVTIAPKAQPTVSITSGTSSPTANVDVPFTASVTAATNTVISAVHVDYGDGSATNLGAVSGTITLHHVYTTGGTYTVVLTATDSNGGVGTATTVVFVQTATPLTVLVAESQTASGGTTIASFTATVIGLGNAVVVNYRWDFGDSATSNTTSGQTTHNYTTGSGAKTVTVTITTSTGGTASGTIVVIP